MIPTMSHITHPITNPHITIHFIMSHPIHPTTNRPIMIRFIMNPLTHPTTNHPTTPTTNHIIGKSIGAVRSRKE
jgi:hypothetical protein